MKTWKTQIDMEENSGAELNKKIDRSWNIIQRTMKNREGWPAFIAALRARDVTERKRQRWIGSSFIK
uniref:Uncharacterized protein n=1 Tax=Arion vulgaris TaxID=1028688 RepID=A0A0B7AN76_9EUPU